MCPVRSIGIITDFPGKQSNGSAVAETIGREAGGGRVGEGSLFELHVCVQVDLGRFHRFMPQPQSNDADIHASSGRAIAVCVTQGVRGYSFCERVMDTLVRRSQRVSIRGAAVHLHSAGHRVNWERRDHRVLRPAATAIPSGPRQHRVVTVCIAAFCPCPGSEHVRQSQTPRPGVSSM